MMPAARWLPAMIVTCAALLIGSVVAPAAHAAAPADVETPRALLVPDRETTLVAQMVGVVQRLGVEMGGGFRPGALLVRFDCGEQRARLGIAQAELNSAQQQHAAKLRLQGLSAAGEVEVSLAAAAVSKARSQVDLGNAQLAQCNVIAPFPGRVSKLHVREFQGVNIGQPLMDIVSAGPLRVKLNAPSRWLAWLKPGAAFELKVDETGKTYPARVSAINARVDAVSQTIELEGRVQEDSAELLAGMSGNARFALPPP
jgi:membrane fusion protein (multidrug efflux system)